MRKILLIDDNPGVSQMISKVLKKEYEVIVAYSGTEGMMIFEQQPIDLVLLDRMLPGKSGDEVLAEIRNISPIPIIMLTALSDKNDIADLLLAGANDYIAKPFNLQELKARIAVQLRNNSSSSLRVSDSSLSYMNLFLFPDTYELGKGKEKLQLKKKEFDLLALLFQHPNKIFSKEALYNHVWKAPYYGDENTINVHLSSIRRKIKQLDPERDYIETIWGIGIKLV